MSDESKGGFARYREVVLAMAALAGVGGNVYQANKPADLIDCAEIVSSTAELCMLNAVNAERRCDDQMKVCTEACWDIIEVITHQERPPNAPDDGVGLPSHVLMRSNGGPVPAQPHHTHDSEEVHE